MSWHAYRIFRVLALSALLALHSALIGVIVVGMLRHVAVALQFSMDIIVMFTIVCFYILECMRRDTGLSRIPNLIVFSILSILSLVGAIGLSIRGASRGGKGLCEDFASHDPQSCTQAAVAMTLTWVSTLIAFAGLAVSWLDRTPRMAASNSPYGWQGPEKEHEGPKQPQQSKSSFHSSRSHIAGPTASYVPRPRDPYDTPRRKRSTRSQSHHTNPQRTPSHRTPIPPLPPLPSFHPLDLEADALASRRIDRRQGGSTRSNRRGHKDLPDLPPPTRRPSGDPNTRGIRRMRHLSPTELFAQMGG